MNHHAPVSGQPALRLRTRTTRTAARFASSSSLALALALGNKPNNIRISSSRASSPSTNLAKLLPLGLGAFTRRRTIPVANAQSLSGYTTNDAHDDDDGLKPTDNISFASAKEALFGLHPGGVRSELILLALPAVFGQAIDPLAQLMETAYIGRLGALELASAGIGVSIFNIVSKIFNIPLLSIATSFVAEDISKNASKHSSSGKLELSSVSSTLILAAGIEFWGKTAVTFPWWWQIRCWWRTARKGMHFADRGDGWPRGWPGLAGAGEKEMGADRGWLGGGCRERRDWRVDREGS